GSNSRVPIKAQKPNVRRSCAISRKCLTLAIAGIKNTHIHLWFILASVYSSVIHLRGRIAEAGELIEGIVSGFEPSAGVGVGVRKRACGRASQAGQRGVPAARAWRPAGPLGYSRTRAAPDDQLRIPHP